MDSVEDGSTTEICGICKRVGKISKLKVYQINFQEAIKFCEDETCSYPLGLETQSEMIINRNFADISNSPKKKTSVTPTNKPNKTGVKPVQTTKSQKLRLPSLTKLAPAFSKQTSLAPYITGQRNDADKSPQVSNVKHKSMLKKTNTDSGLFCVSDLTKSLGEKARNQPLFLQWQNKDALCWLDVILCLFVHSKQLQKYAELESNKSCLFQKDQKSILVTLFKAYQQACELLNKSDCTKDNQVFNDSVSSEEKTKEVNSSVVCTPHDISHDFQYLSVIDNRNLKTGAGLSSSTSLLPTLPSSQQVFSKTLTILHDVREMIFQKLQPRLKCVKGKNDSPIFALPLLVNDRGLEKLMTAKYRFRLRCEACKYEQEDSYVKILTTLPSSVKDFCMSEPAFLCPCFKCRTPGQRRKMIYEKLPEILLFHFVEGLPHCDASRLDFRYGDRDYRLRGLIQYRNDPDHFVTWIRDETNGQWLECDDLKSPVCQFQEVSLPVPPNQIHIVMWEASNSGDSPGQHMNTIANGVGKSHVDNCRQELGNRKLIFTPTDVTSSPNINGQNPANIIDKSMTLGRSVEKISDLSVQPKKTSTSHVTGNQMLDQMSENCAEPTTDLSNFSSGDSPESSDHSHLCNDTRERPPKFYNESGMSSHLSPSVSSDTGGQGLMVIQLTPLGEIIPVHGADSNSAPLNLQNIVTMLNDQFADPASTHQDEPTTDSSIANQKQPGSEQPINVVTIQLSTIKSGETKPSTCQTVNNRSDEKQQSCENNKLPHGIALLRTMKSKTALNSLTPKAEENVGNYSGRKKKSSKSTNPGKLSSTKKQTFLSTIIESNKSSPSLVPRLYKSQKFAGYKMDALKQSDVAHSSNYYKTDARASSPALSTQSDTVVVHKRKRDIEQLSHRQKFKKRKSVDCASLPDIDLAQIEDDSNMSVCQSPEIPESLEATNSQECDILQSLYSALNLPLPSAEEPPGDHCPLKSAMSEETFMPDISDLENFLEGNSKNSPVMNMDEFLSCL